MRDLRRGVRELWAVLRRVWWNLTLFVGLIVAAALLLQASNLHHVHGEMTTCETLVAANPQKASVVLVAL